MIELAICWTMSDDALEPQWTDPKGFSVVIEGEPRVDATIRFGEPGQDVMTVLMASTAVAAVNAIPFLCDAQPGVITRIDLPITGSPGALTPDLRGRLPGRSTPPVARRGAVRAAEQPAEIPGVGHSHPPGDLGDRQVGFGEQRPGLAPCGVR